MLADNNCGNHELEHASQYEKSANKSIGNDDAPTLEQRLNDEHYYSSSGDRVVHVEGERYRTIRFDDETDFQLYRAQACEADARAAGLKAVGALRESNIQNGIQDAYIDNYLEYAQANEINDNRDMMSKLGMHSRENMAREELEHISNKRVSAEDRKKVIEYARQKDYETAKAVISQDSNGNLTEEQIKQHFEKNEGYQDFYQTERYNALKVKEGERKDYKYSTYKWADNGEQDADVMAESRDAFRQKLNTGQAASLMDVRRNQFRNEAQSSGRKVDGAEQRDRFSKTMNGESGVTDSAPPLKKGVDNKVERN